MNNVQLTQHLVLLEERAAELEAHMAAIEPVLRHIESALPVPSALSLVAQRLGSIDSKLAQLVPPRDVRHSMEEATEHQEAVADAAPLQAQQLKEMTDWLSNHMTGDQLQFQFDDLMFVTKQLISLWQGSRDEQVLMRADIRRLAALCEQVLADKAEPPWRMGDDERRKASGF